MKAQGALLVALVLLVAGAAAGPIRPVAEPTQKGETQYVFVKLLFEGHDQPNFERWHANATAATVAQVAGVPLSYLTTMVDGKVPGTEQSAPAPPTKRHDSFRPHAPAAAPEPAQVPATTPAPAAPVAITTPAPVGAAPGSTVSLITAPDAAKSAESAQKAVQTTPESGEGDIPAPQQQPQQRSGGFWSSVQQVLSGSTVSSSTTTTAPQQTTQQAEPTETPVEIRSTRPRVFVVGGRRLKGSTQLNPNQALVEYAIRTNASEPWAVRDTIKRKLMSSAAGFGMAQGTQLRGFYTLLKEHGMGYYPAMWVDGEQILTGDVGLEAPHNRFVNATKGPKNFQHKLYKHTDLVKPKAPATNGTRSATNVTVAEPAFIMANRSTATEATTVNAPAPKKSGLPAWGVALIVLSTVTVAVAMAATVWRCVRERRRRQAEEEAAHSEPLSPQSVRSTH